MKIKGPLKNFIDNLLYWIIRVLGMVVRNLPLKIALGLGGNLGKLGYFFSPKRSLIAYKNLKLAMGREDKEYFTAVIRSVYSNLGMNLVEVLRFPLLTSENINDYVEVHGLENIKESLKKGKGVILLTGHFGNWELSALAAALMGYQMKILAREQKFERLNGLLNSYRQLKGCEVIPKGMAIREIIRYLKQNGIIGMLSDQDGGRRGVFVNFFGRPASTPRGAIDLALRTGCQVLPTFIIRRNGRHYIKVERPLNFKEYPDEKSAIQNGLQYFTSLLESYIRRYPSQWLWLHNRWKTQP